MRLRHLVTTGVVAWLTSSSLPRKPGDRRGIVWLRFKASPFQAEWDVFDVTGPEGVNFDRNLLLDVDGDGDLDIVNTEEHDNAAGVQGGLGVVWYENPIRVRPAGPLVHELTP
jgi:hypothetical protein